MCKFLMPLIAALFLFNASIPAHAQEAPVDEQLVQIRLIAERAQVSGGDEIWVGIEKSIAPHWHTYWKNPGDSGTITKAEWTLPEGASIEEIIWPTPKRLPYGPLLNYGYEDNVVLLQRLKLPETLPEGALTISADIELLVCKEECIPEYGTYTLTLNGPQSETEDNSAYFETALTKLPITVSWPATFEQTDKSFKLSIEIPETIAKDIKPETLEFFPTEWGLIENAAPQSALLNGTKLTFSQNIGERHYKELETAKFLIAYENKQGRASSFEVLANAKGETEAASIVALPVALEQTDGSITIAKALILALLGGIVLNLMPCVFPILSIKALSLVKISDESPALARMHGLSYTVGVILSFIAIAAILLILKAAGAEIGWGFQLQNPIVVGALAYLLFIVGLNLMGFFEFGNRLGNVGNKLTQNQGIGGSFFTGVLATLVATPCTAPFMAAAIGFALTQSAFVNLSVFAALGLGLALPYLALSILPSKQAQVIKSLLSLTIILMLLAALNSLMTPILLIILIPLMFAISYALLSLVPSLNKGLPKPGAWMNTFKELLAFPIFLSAIWLTWVVAKQAGSTGVLQLLIGISAITFGIWLLKKASGKVVLKVIAITAFAIAIFMATTQQTQITSPINQSLHSAKFGETFTPQKLEQILSEEENPVFVEMTAAWCITCKVNNKMAINIDSTKKAFADNNVRYLVGDWTNQDPEITKYLNKHGRNGVPIYVYYGPRDVKTDQRPETKILPQILTPRSITKLFD